MSATIGVLLPRSTDYPAMGFDILDGVRSYFKQIGKFDVRFITENIGFGEDSALNYAKAEKLILQDDAQLIIAYCNPKNAEPLYVLAAAVKRPFIFLDAGVQHPETMQHPFAFHISLQAMQASYMLGMKAGEGGRKVLMATSFLDGGYRIPWAAVKGLEEKQGAVCGNYVSAYRVSDFNIDQYLSLIESVGAEAVVASFSVYLSELFLNRLKTAGTKATSLPFYCSSFMAEEQQLEKCDFPGGTFETFVPWASSIENKSQQLFADSIVKEKNKQANLFHLLGWEAGIVSAFLLENKTNPEDVLKGWSFQSPRGIQTFHPDTHYTYGPLYHGYIVEGKNGKCTLNIQEEIPSDPALHVSIMSSRLEASSDWKNNYLCI